MKTLAVLKTPFIIILILQNFEVGWDVLLRV